ncbi:protein kinase domain-containing protein [Actinoplanes sp. HUAS TT8]|uniref:serine/threonine-protein kinase n=1 Tax=Actinoplanes sp. HUAS TT8 TaxID=3447453 RepID=UPI003F528ADC
MSGWQLSGYTPVRPLGAGASGSVVLAVHDETGTSVAIKYLTPGLGDDATFRAAFRREARLLGEIDDPHVSRLYEYVETADGAAIVMELVNGVTLRQMLREHGPTSPEAALVVLKGSLAGLAAAHMHGVVHRDYKPENVLVDGDGLSKLADFGIAMPVGEGADTVVSGTPRYMAPEQWHGSPATPACDIYAATATFFECLTGKPPYDGTTIFVLHEQHTSAPIPTDPAPEPVHDLLRLGMAKQPADRPPHAQAFLAILEQVAGTTYGPEWEEHGLRDLARRAALLAALWPFPDSDGGAISFATTTLATEAGKPGGGGLRRGRGWVALAAGALVAALLGGGVAYQYAAADEHVTFAGETSPATAGPASIDPASSESATPQVSVGPSASLAAPATGSTSTPATSKSPTGTPSKSPAPSASASASASASTSASASASPSAGASPDTTAPTVGSVGANPTSIESEGCRYGVRTSTIRVTVTDDRSGPTALKVGFQYTLNGTKSTVSMSSAARNVFTGTLGPLPMPRTTTRIPISVVATDAAGNTGTSASTAYVTLSNLCTPG